MENDIKMFYDLMAEKTADEWYSEDILKPTINDFISLLPPNPHVLDLGCGPGHESMRLDQAGAKVTGIDFSEKCINIARQRCPQCKFDVKDFRILDEAYGKFEGVFACASLIHISPTELGEVLRNIKKVLVDGGYVAIVIVEGEGINGKYSILEVEGRKLNRAFYQYTLNYLLKEAEKADLEYVHEGYLDEKLKKDGWRNYLFKSG
ncbi:class I SAM-dependent methyltransferase [uncultured Methanolobus sp.]|uniref:class I SAM-dependent methyltransferase n=1 Tax=uncultured Methanolobus sp. TaxID=218300 RepID=UPI002AAB2266|nr:class I SAM-dependent methyltransferase [uncultured Methanolobus sp.]